MQEGVLVLKSGEIFEGWLHGEGKPSQGEVIFNTSMTGYQEILTDPSYSGQIITMTYPHIGNYGINSEDMESTKVHAQGLVVKELSLVPSNWRSSKPLGDWLMEHGVAVLEGIDTRALVKRIRTGECNGIIVAKPGGPEALEQLRQSASNLQSMEGQNWADRVSTTDAYDWESPLQAEFQVVAYDFGIKHNILRLMEKLGIQVRVVPSTTPTAAVLAQNPDGVFLSNGPGDPSVVRGGIENMKGLLGQVPIFGICLGHQILSLALGCRTYKLECGHHGANHPIMDYQTNKIEIASHNHGFAVDEMNLPPDVRVTHRNLNDQTIAGIESTNFPAYSVQYHPEAAPGPHDSRYLFQRFVEMMKNHRRS
jgi:carbamoyl-phosphate synthase small subunit